MINREEHGVKQGFWLERSSEGQCVGHYEQGKKIGSWCYYAGQRLTKTVQYVDDVMEGHGFKFGPAGNLLLDVEFEKDRINGQARFFASDGQLIAVYSYVYDKLNTVDLYVLHDESPPKAKTFVPDF
jgi:antitoxin component YwqK of YwqJK toxin-antitoxin module